MYIQWEKAASNVLFAKNSQERTGAHPAYFKWGEGSFEKKNSIPHSGVDPENFGGGDALLN